MLALQIVAGAMLLAGSLAVVAFLRWLEAQEAQPLGHHSASLHPLARRATRPAPRQALRRAA